MGTDKTERWRAHQAAQREGGLSAAAYCRRHGLSYASWMYWQRRLGPSVLMPIQVASSSLSMEVRLPGSVSLRVSGATAADVVALVRGLSC